MMGCMMKTFVVKIDPERLWQYDASDPGIVGFEIKAFTPEGAAIKASNRGLTHGLKNYVVELDGQKVASLYPMDEPLLAYLDAPLTLLRWKFEYHFH